MSDAEMALNMLRVLIFLSPKDPTQALSGKWLKGEVTKKEFSRLWEFSVEPALKRLSGLYGGTR
jgi:hypothetical protein